jgi:hypothetical protein
LEFDSAAADPTMQQAQAESLALELEAARAKLRACEVKSPLKFKILTEIHLEC